MNKSVLATSCEVLANRNKLRAFVFEQYCVPWRLKRYFKRHFLRLYRCFAYGRVNINTSSHWNEIWEREGLDTWRVYPARFTRIATLVPPGSRVLDVGCGPGVLLSRLREHRRCKPFGLDISTSAIRLMGRVGIPGAACAVPDLPVLAGAFDVVIATELIEHLDDPAAALTEFVRCLRPGGKVILTTPNNTLGPADEDQHMHQFSVEKLEAIAANALEDIQIEVFQETWREDGRGSEECLLLTGRKREIC
jgi:SAM-dependent methyltransferase